MAPCWWVGTRRTTASLHLSGSKDAQRSCSPTWSICNEFYWFAFWFAHWFDWLLLVYIDCFWCVLICWLTNEGAKSFWDSKLSMLFKRGSWGNPKMGLLQMIRQSSSFKSWPSVVEVPWLLDIIPSVRTPNCVEISKSSNTAKNKSVTNWVIALTSSLNRWIPRYRCL